MTSIFRKIFLAVSLGILVPAGALNAQSEDSDGTILSASLIWTGQPDADQKKGACVAFRKHFQVAEAEKKLTLQIFADARYMLWVNGQYVQRGPARFEPLAPEYDSMDITTNLRNGDNVIVVLVTSRISNGKTRMHAPGLTAQLMQAGQVICRTDTSWKWSDQTRYRAVKTDWPNIYDTVDARVEDDDWTLADYDDSKWAAAQPGRNTWGALTARRIPLLRETAVEPVWPAGTTWPVTLNAGGQVSFKFQHLVLAYIQIEMDADEGSVLELTYSPKTTITCRAGKQTYISTDTHSIFEGGIRVKSGRVTLQSVKFVERLYPFNQIGTFNSSDPLLNQLWKTCVRGLEITSEDAYVDCTDRERVEWMDCDPPAFDVTRVAMAGSTAEGREIDSDPRLLEEMLRRTAYTLQPDGWVKAHTSSDRFDIHAKMEDRACDWVEGARRYYESCGRTNLIREIWPAIVAQMNYFLDRQTPRGLVLAREWVVWGDPVGYQTCEGTALNAFIQHALGDAAFLGNLIGEKEQAAKFSRAAKDMAVAINKVLWDEKAGTYFAGYYDLATAKKSSDYRSLKLKIENNLIEPTRHAALFTLDQGVVPKNRRVSVTKYLMANVPADNNIMQYYYFFKQQYAMDDPAQDLAVLNRQRADWKDMAESPYEAAFEGLHSWGSQAHCYGMFPAYFLSSYVLGVRPDGPVQRKSLLIEPRLGDLTAASGTVETEFGPVAVSWKQAGWQWNYIIDNSKLTAGTIIHLRLPVGNGNFSAELDDAALKAGIHKVKHQGRWLDVPLTSGKHHGFWKLIPIG
jgi:alpha-L-rhamnosidase